MYEALREKLHTIKTAVQKELESGPDQQANSAKALVQEFKHLKQAWAECQNWLQNHPHPRWQSLCTEMHKQLRLAEIDVQFWATARQAPKATQRGQQLCDRLSTMIGYCDAGLQLSQQNEEQA